MKLHCHFSWQVQYLVKSKRHLSWQAQYLVKLNSYFSWRAQHSVKFGMMAGVRIMLYFSTQNGRGGREK